MPPTRKGAGGIICIVSELHDSTMWKTMAGILEG